MIKHGLRDHFLKALETRDPVNDKFAGTFRAKADAMDLWPDLLGSYDGPDLLAAIIIRLSKRQPVVANLQLLHTFAAWRRRGLAAALVTRGYNDAVDDGAQYLRVSAEPEAVPFYRRQGFRFWGEQKSGALLSIFRVAGRGCPIEDGVYDRDDRVIAAALGDGFNPRKGQLVHFFGDPQ